MGLFFLLCVCDGNEYCGSVASFTLARPSGGGYVFERRVIQIE